MRLLVSAIFSIVLTIVSVFSFYLVNINDTTPEVKLTHLHKTIYIDRTFNVQQKYLIELAAAEWQNSTNGIIKFETVKLPTSEVLNPINSILICNVTPDDPDIIELDAFAKSDSFHLGWTNLDHAIPNIKIVSSRVNSSAKFKTTILHELGHAIGLSHNEGKSGENSLMYPAINFGSDKITQKDLKKFCEKYFCDNKNVSQK